jgi:EAL domain-containing protein (putative c-di-GMP-specific phosphodiesterase class I)
MGAEPNHDPLYDFIASASTATPSGERVRQSLEAIRNHLGMEVAYISEFVGDQAVFRAVDAPGLEAIIKVGDTQSLDDIYCRHILAGRLPELIPDTSREPIAVGLPITKAVPIGRHASVPIRLRDGTVHGMFCCLGFEPDASLHERDIRIMRVFADLTAIEIGRELDATKLASDKAARIRSVIENGEMSMVYQPICQVKDRRPIGFEALARFSGAPSRTPDKWFAEAAEAGLGALLEVAAIRLALAALPSLPPDVYMAVNVSPETILSKEFAGLMERQPAERLVLEITEHAEVADYDALLGALRPLLDRGMRLAVDDTGAGYSSLQHIVRLRPNLIKLDMDLTRDVDTDPARRALTAALTTFARNTGSGVIAEGVETAPQLAMLESIGVDQAQGYFLGRPLPLEGALKLCG